MNANETGTMLGNSFGGSTGDPPVPSGDSPDGGSGDSSQWGRAFRDFACRSSGRRVADRGGRVARATHFQNRLLADISVD